MNKDYEEADEIVLKDISTVSNDPRNLIVWADTVGSVLDKYYS